MARGPDQHAIVFAWPPCQAMGVWMADGHALPRSRSGMAGGESAMDEEVNLMEGRVTHSLWSLPW